MFNLLPENQRKNIEREYKMRRLVVAGALFLAVLVVAVVSLAAPDILFRQKYKEAKQNSSYLEKSAVLKKSEQLSLETKLANQKIESLKPEATIAVYDLFKKIVNNKPAGIKIESLSYSKKNTERIDVSVGGVASNREALMDFQKNLGKEQEFVNVDLPLSDLVKGVNAPFLIKITAKIK